MIKKSGIQFDYIETPKRGSNYEKQTLELFCISNRVERLEESVLFIQQIIDKIRSNIIYRIFRRSRMALTHPRNFYSYIYDDFLNSPAYEVISHFIGKVTKRYYVEDYIRVYPDGIIFDQRGRQLEAGDNALKNYVNHLKFYKFVAQFVKDKRIADIGCGSGYGCGLIKKFGASEIYGTDISKHAIRFANSHYGNDAEFSVQSITNLKEYSDAFFDVTVSSEVLEHIKEYGVEQKAIDELKRITKPEGLVIIGTPNNEMLDGHGFSFDEINELFDRNFSKFCIFENALIPFGESKPLWEKRLKEYKLGVIISEKINLSETFLPDGKIPEIKAGIKAGIYKFEDYEIDTTLLHNTHSWVVLAINDK